MKFISSLLLIALLAFAFCLFLPSWTVVLAGFVAALVIVQTPGKAFLAGFLSVFLLWAGLAFWISSRNDHLLAHKISLIILKMDNPYLLILVSGLLGGLMAGLGALTASFARRPASND